MLSEPWPAYRRADRSGLYHARATAAASSLADRATFLAQKANLDLVILHEKSKGRLNVYHVIVVNPAKHPNVNVVAARAWAAWITRPDTQDLISKFGVDKYGEPLFFPDAGKPEPAS